jgi:hypothetical protein
MLYVLAALILLMLIFPGHRVGAIAGLFHAWWIAPVGVIAPLVVLAIVLLAPQMPDMIAGMTDGSVAKGWRQLGYGLGFGSGVLGLSAWYWTRAVLNAVAKGDDQGAPYAPDLPDTVAASPSPFWTWFEEGYRQAPRWAALPAGVLSVSPPLLALWHPELADPAYGKAAALSAAIFAATVLPFTVFRRTRTTAAIAPPLLWMVLALTEPDPSPLRWVGVVLVAALLAVAWVGLQRGLVPTRLPAWAWRYPPVALVFGAPLGWPVGLLVLAAAPVVCTITQLCPTVVSEVAHAPPVAMIALALIIGPFSVVLALLRWVAFPWGAWARAPGGQTVKQVVGAGLLVMIVFVTPPQLEPPGLYAIRDIEPRELPERPDLRKALSDYRAYQTDTCHFPKDAPMPVVIAAAEGGASRAALWFLSAARTLDGASEGAFGRYLFAISGVSGGSLGAVTYLQALAAERAQGLASCAGPRLDPGNEAFQVMVNGDPLAVALAGYFLDDALMRVLPLRLIWPHLADRAAMLERAFEAAWPAWWPESRQAEGQAAAAGGLLDLRLRRLGAGAPHLFLNGTDADTGRRLITATVRFAPGEELFPFADDLLQTERADVPAATAVTNSARFPLISPAGQLPDNQRVIDGGYYDNYGSRTADDLVIAITRISAESNLNLVPIVVVVSDDAVAPADTLEAMTVSCGHPLPVPSGGDAVGNAAQKQADVDAQRAQRNEPTYDAPVIGLLSTRDAHAEDGLAILRNALCKDNRMVHIALPKPDTAKGQAAPMNWVLNQAAWRFMMVDAPTACFNRQQAVLFRNTVDGVLSGHSQASNLHPGPTGPFPGNSEILPVSGGGRIQAPSDLRPAKICE